MRMTDKFQNIAGTVLIVDDDLPTRQILEKLLTQEGYEVRCAPSGQMGLLFASEEPPELILLDARMPDMDGFEVCRRLKESPATEKIPVIFMSGLTDAQDKMRAFAEGTADYVTKPFEAEDLLRRVKKAVTAARLRKTDQSPSA